MSSSSKPKIAHVDTGTSLRGGQRQLLLLAEGLRVRGHEQVIVCLEGSSLEDRAQKEGFRVFTFPANDPGHAFGILLWRQQLRLWLPHILHAHDGRGQTLSWLASLGLGVKRVASRRVTFFPSDRWTYRLKYGHTCDAVIAVSENIRELSVQAGVPRERITVIPDGIEIPADLPPATERLRLRASWDCGPEEFVIGLLGAGTAEKGQDTALAAMARLAEALPQARLIIAGDEAAVSGGETAESPASSGTAIHRLGRIENLANFFPGLDVFVMPSKAEGLGSSTLWAMAHGLPVIATRVGGLPEIVIQNQTGWLVPPNSPQALAEAILLASRDSEKLHAFGRHGRERAQKFSANVMVDRTEALYARLLGV